MILYIGLHQPEKLSEVVDEMRERSIRPDDRSYSILLNSKQETEDIQDSKLLDCFSW